MWHVRPQHWRISITMAVHKLRKQGHSITRRRVHLTQLTPRRSQS